MRPLLPFLLVLAACGPRARATVPLRVAVWGALKAVGSQQAGSLSWSFLPERVLFQPLIDIGANGEIVPVLAARAEVVPDNRLKIWLRPNLRLTDGSPVTFDDVAKSLNEHELHAEQDNDAILIGSSKPHLPVELPVSGARIHRGNLGTSDFVLRDQSAEQISLARKTPLPGRINEVIVTSYKTPQEAFAHTLKGDANMLPEVDSRWIEFFDGVPRLKVLRSPSTHANIIAFNVHRLSREERRALSSALDDSQLRNLGYGEDCQSEPQRESAPQKPLPGRPLSILEPPRFERPALAMQRILGSRGEDPTPVSLDDYLKVVQAGNFDLALARPVISPPIMAVLSWRTGLSSNVLGYSNPAVDAALDARDWNAARRALEEDPPAVFVCTATAAIVVDSRIANAALGPALYESIANWEVRP